MGLDPKETDSKLSKPMKIFLSIEIKLLLFNHNLSNFVNPLKIDAPNKVS